MPCEGRWLMDSDNAGEEGARVEWRVAPPPKQFMRHPPAAWLHSARAEYQRSGNPLYAWTALRVALSCDEIDVAGHRRPCPVPDWVANYIVEAADALAVLESLAPLPTSYVAEMAAPRNVQCIRLRWDGERGEMVETGEVALQPLTLPLRSWSHAVAAALGLKERHFSERNTRHEEMQAAWFVALFRRGGGEVRNRHRGGGKHLPLEQIEGCKDLS